MLIARTGLRASGGSTGHAARRRLFILLTYFHKKTSTWLIQN